VTIERAGADLGLASDIVEAGGSAVARENCFRNLQDALAVALGIGARPAVPVLSIHPEKAVEHFGPFFGHAAQMDMPASSEWTRNTLRWQPAGPGLIEDLENMQY
jgi:hypothetical protein